MNKVKKYLLSVLIPLIVLVGIARAERGINLDNLFAYQEKLASIEQKIAIAKVFARYRDNAYSVRNSQIEIAALESEKQMLLKKIVECKELRSRNNF
jgi:hypothetical protein